MITVTAAMITLEMSQDIDKGINQHKEFRNLEPSKKEENKSSEKRKGFSSVLKSCFIIGEERTE